MVTYLTKRVFEHLQKRKKMQSFREKMVVWFFAKTKKNAKKIREMNRCVNFFLGLRTDVVKMGTRNLMMGTRNPSWES